MTGLSLANWRDSEIHWYLTWMLRADEGRFSEGIEFWFSVIIHSPAGLGLFSYWGITCCLRQLPKSHVTLLFHFNKVNHGISYSHFSLNCYLPGDALHSRQKIVFNGVDRQMEFFKRKFSKEETGFGDGMVVHCLCLQPE